MAQDGRLGKHRHQKMQDPGQHGEVERLKTHQYPESNFLARMGFSPFRSLKPAAEGSQSHQCQSIGIVPYPSQRLWSEVHEEQGRFLSIRCVL
jgi:hypothetical protein